MGGRAVCISGVHAATVYVCVGYRMVGLRRLSHVAHVNLVNRMIIGVDVIERIKLTPV